MCSNYQALRELERMERCFRLQSSNMPLFPSETWTGYLAPYMRRAPDSAEHTRELRAGQFGLMPHWTKDAKFGRHTYNARSGTAATKNSFRDSWGKGRRAIIPADAIYEPNYETGKPIRWRIKHVDGEPLGIAGLWSWWPGLDGEGVESFSMLTVNADEHPLMKRFHKKEDEKRMAVILDPADFDRWLDCQQDEMMSMMTRYPAELLTAEPAPAPPRKKKVIVGQDEPPLI